MTGMIFNILFITIYGYAIGKTFKKLNPFFMLFGMFFTLPILIHIEQINQPLLYLLFGIGFIFNFENILKTLKKFILLQINNSSTHQRDQSNRNFNSSPLNPKNFNDACEILGCLPTEKYYVYKQAYRHLTSIYHPDKINKLRGQRKKQAEDELRDINIAWFTVRKNIKK